MTNKNELKRNMTLAAAALILVLPACSHGPVVQDFPVTANPVEETKRLDADMVIAAGNQAAVLSPGNFASAQASLADAWKGVEKQNDAKDILHQVSVGRAYFNRAIEVSKLSRVNMEDVVIARQQAIAAGASASFSGDFNTADESLKDVTRDIEKNDLSSAGRERGTLQGKYLALELKSIKEVHLGRARDMIAIAVQEGARELAPRTLAAAEKDLKDIDGFINANRHANDQLAIRSAKTLESSNHVLKITRASKTSKKTSPEDTALQMEKEQGKVADKQVELVSKQAQLDTKQGQLDSKSSELSKEQRASAALTTANQSLESEQDFNRSFEEARSEFAPGEAEVYKQGNTLMIRLRGLEFPSSQAVLRGSNFPLLAKVQKVIKDFGQSSVVVEGHTDSRGGSVLNEKLSTERAEAVKAYFLTNSENHNFNIRAVGYGYQKPLSTNKTANGRAQNRRVDVLIERTQGL